MNNAKMRLSSFSDEELFEEIRYRNQFKKESFKGLNKDNIHFGEMFEDDCKKPLVFLEYIEGVEYPFMMFGQSDDCFSYFNERGELKGYRPDECNIVKKIKTL